MKQVQKFGVLHCAWFANNYFCQKKIKQFIIEKSFRLDNLTVNLILWHPKINRPRVINYQLLFLQPLVIGICRNPIVSEQKQSITNLFLENYIKPGTCTAIALSGSTRKSFYNFNSFSRFEERTKLKFFDYFGAVPTSWVLHNKKSIKSFEKSFEER